MIKKELHSHTTFCDGNNTPEEMVKAAIEKGFQTLGFSGHSYTFFDERYCMSKAGTRQYKEEIARLKEKYKSDIEILCGTEQDYSSDMPTEGYDYVIGSVHYMKAGDRYIPVDETPDILISAAKKHFGGDMIELCRCYYETVADVVAKTGADIIGHFDLITKFNENGALFDTNDERYIHAWRQSADRLLKTGAVFEINTGAIARGYRTAPYPAPDIIAYLKARGATFILSGDAHSTDDIGYRFEDYEYLLD